MASTLPVRWTPRALNDLEDIRDYIAVDRPLAAERMKRRLVEVSDRLTHLPARGRAVGVSRELLVVRPYVIRYRITVEAVVILGVRRSQRRPVG